MQWRSTRIHNGNASHFTSGFCKLHAPGQRRRLAPTASGGKAALPTDSVAESDAGRESVGGFPPGKFVTSNQKVADDDCAKKAAVKNSAGAQEIEREDLQWVLTIFRLRKEHQNLRADNRREQHPQSKIVNTLARQPIARR